MASRLKRTVRYQLAHIKAPILQIFDERLLEALGHGADDRLTGHECRRPVCHQRVVVQQAGFQPLLHKQEALQERRVSRIHQRQFRPVEIGARVTTLGCKCLLEPRETFCRGPEPGLPVVVIGGVLDAAQTCSERGHEIRPRTISRSLNQIIRVQTGHFSLIKIFGNGIGLE